MRISDWSSDVCSSDLADPRQLPCRHRTDQDDGAIVDYDKGRKEHELRPGQQQQGSDHNKNQKPAYPVRFEQQYGRIEIGRASCRERVCQYVEITVVAVSLKKK